MQHMSKIHPEHIYTLLITSQNTTRDVRCRDDRKAYDLYSHSSLCLPSFGVNHQQRATTNRENPGVSTEGAPEETKVCCKAGTKVGALKRADSAETDTESRGRH